MLSLLPALLLVALIASLLLLPVLRQLRRDLESIEQSQGESRRPPDSLRKPLPGFNAYETDCDDSESQASGGRYPTERMPVVEPAHMA